MKITEKMLLDGYVGVSNGLDYISDIEKMRFHWIYRYDGSVCSRESAEEVTYEGQDYDKEGITVDYENDYHPAIKKMDEDFFKVCHER